MSLQPNTIYTLTYFVGERYDVPLSVYSVALKAGSTTLASDSGGSPVAGQFVQRVITFTTGTSPASGILNIDVAATGFAVTGAGGQSAFDLFALDATPVNGTVPEPASVVLCGSLLLAFTIRKASSRNRSNN